MINKDLKMLSKNDKITGLTGAKVVIADRKTQFRVSRSVGKYVAIYFYFFQTDFSYIPYSVDKSIQYRWGLWKG